MFGEKKRRDDFGIHHFPRYRDVHLGKQDIDADDVCGGRDDVVERTDVLEQALDLVLACDVGCDRPQPFRVRQVLPCGRQPVLGAADDRNLSAGGKPLFGQRKPHAGTAANDQDAFVFWCGFLVHLVSIR